MRADECQLVPFGINLPMLCGQPQIIVECSGALRRGMKTGGRP